MTEYISYSPEPVNTSEYNGRDPNIISRLETIDFKDPSNDQHKYTEKSKKEIGVLCISHDFCFIYPISPLSPEDLRKRCANACPTRRGCADVRMCGCADVRMCRCADVPMCPDSYRDADVRMCPDSYRDADVEYIAMQDKLAFLERESNPLRNESAYCPDSYRDAGALWQD
jgi:hypothetical protein